MSSAKDLASILAILDSIGKILDYLTPFTDPDSFYNDQKTFDAVLMNFIVIGEMTGRISDSFKENRPEIEWHEIRGFRNIVAHNYFGVDPEEVWAIITKHLPQLKSQLSEIVDNREP